MAMKPPDSFTRIFKMKILNAWAKKICVGGAKSLKIPKFRNYSRLFVYIHS